VFVACNVLVLFCCLQFFGLGVFVDILCSCLIRRLLIVPGVSSLFARGRCIPCWFNEIIIHPKKKKKKFKTKVLFN